MSLILGDKVKDMYRKAMADAEAEHTKLRAALETVTLNALCLLLLQVLVDIYPMQSLGAFRYSPPHHARPPDCAGSAGAGG